LEFGIFGIWDLGFGIIWNLEFGNWGFGIWNYSGFAASLAVSLWLT
jgi:hypothetical protein